MRRKWPGPRRWYSYRSWLVKLHALPLNKSHLGFDIRGKPNKFVACYGTPIWYTLELRLAPATWTTETPFTVAQAPPTFGKTYQIVEWPFL